MLKYSVAVVALLAGTSLACAQQPDHGSNNSGAGMSNSASEHAPGQMKDSGSAKGGVRKRLSARTEQRRW